MTELESRIRILLLPLLPRPLKTNQRMRQAQLISRNGNPFSSFDDLRKGLALPVTRKTVLDGEIVCLDKRGRQQFRDLLFHRGEPCFFAFDLLMSDGGDLRPEKLADRKQELRRALTGLPKTSRLLVDHEQHGTALFRRVCEMDLEGIIAKHSLASYTTERTTWFKIKRIEIILRCKDVKNYLNGNVIRNLLLAGTVVNWPALR